MARVMKYFLLTAVVLLLLFDLGRTYRNFANTTLDGDIGRIVTPSSDYEPVLSNPLGIGVWKEGGATAAPNRFAAHYGFGLWMNHVPKIFGEGGANALYHAVALLKMLTHMGLVLLLYHAVGRAIKLSLPDKLIALLLISALFHDSGVLREYFAVVDPSVTYTFFYATQSLLLIAFGSFLVSMTEFGLAGLLVVGLGAPLLALGGPLNGPVMGIGGAIYFAGRRLADGRGKAGLDYKDLFLAYVVVWAAYSFWLGQFNTEQEWARLDLSDRFERLGQGLKIVFEPWRGAWFFLFPVIVFNLFCARHNATANRVYAWYAALAVFIVIWVALLPFGGYREYRYFIIRRDTLLPVNLALMFMFTHSSLLALKRHVLLFLPALLCALYLLGLDWMNRPTNKPERAQFERLIDSDGECVHLPRLGTLMHWSFNDVGSCEDSRLNAIYLVRLGVLKRDILYDYAPAMATGNNTAADR